MKNTREKELKLLSAPRVRSRFFSLPAVRERIIAGSRHTLRLENVYYDTPDRRLAGAGLAYRIRCTDGKAWECTVKTRGKTVGGFTDRGEYTLPLPSAEPVFSGFSEAVDARLQEIVRRGAPQPFCKVVFTRRLALLQLNRQTVAEASVDEGSIEAGSRTAPIGEIELELKKGSGNDLLRFAADLAETVPLYPEKRSKLKRALDLCGRGPSEAETDLVVPGTEDAFSAWRQIALEHIDSAFSEVTQCWQDEQYRCAGLADALEEVAALWEWGRPLLSQRAYAEGRNLLAAALPVLQPLREPEEGIRLLRKLSRDFAARALTEARQKASRKEMEALRLALSRGGLAAALWRLWVLSGSRGRQQDRVLTAEEFAAEALARNDTAFAAADTLPRISAPRLRGEMIFLEHLEKQPAERFCRRARKYLKEVSRWECIRGLCSKAQELSRKEKGRAAGSEALVFKGYLLFVCGQVRRKVLKQGEKLQKEKSQKNKNNI